VQTVSSRAIRRTLPSHAGAHHLRFAVRAPRPQPSKARCVPRRLAPAHATRKPETQMAALATPSAAPPAPATRVSSALPRRSHRPTDLSVFKVYFRRLCIYCLSLFLAYSYIYIANLARAGERLPAPERCGARQLAEQLQLSVGKHAHLPENDRSRLRPRSGARRRRAGTDISRS